MEACCREVSLQSFWGNLHCSRYRAFMHTVPCVACRAWEYPAALAPKPSCMSIKKLQTQTPG
eukprot:516382-Lingulodinium_polyedra.AAC.1